MDLAPVDEFFHHRRAAEFLQHPLHLLPQLGGILHQRSARYAERGMLIGRFHDGRKGRPVVDVIVGVHPPDRHRHARCFQALAHPRLIHRQAHAVDIGAGEDVAELFQFARDLGIRPRPIDNTARTS